MLVGYKALYDEILKLKWESLNSHTLQTNGTPAGVDSRALNEPALREGVAFNPGPDWSADPDDAANYIRLCFALPSETEIWEGVEKLAEVFRKEGAIP